MNYTLLAIFATAFCLHATAQQETTDSLMRTTTQREMMPAWQQVWQEMMENDETDDGLTVDLYDLLQELSEHPINLNQATREELEQLPFLSSQQVMDLIEYRDRYGALLSMGEVRMVQSMDYQQLALLPYFTYLDKPDETQRFPKLKNIPIWAISCATGCAMSSATASTCESGWWGLRMQVSLSLPIATVGGATTTIPTICKSANWDG